MKDEVSVVDVYCKVHGKHKDWVRIRGEDLDKTFCVRCVAEMLEEKIGPALLIDGIQTFTVDDEDKDDHVDDKQNILPFDPVMEDGPEGIA